ncbi:hypothetical protein Trydic_g4197 [Trypoxylus dichotomus]
MKSENYDKWLNYYDQLRQYCTMNEMDDFYYNAEIEYITEIIRNKLYFGSTYGGVYKSLKTTAETLYFTIDEELLYINYYYDFGPLNLSCLYKFCCQLNSYLCNPGIKRIVYYSSGDQNKRANAAYLIGSFAIIYLSISPRRIHQILTIAGGSFRNFVDASQGMSNYTIRLIDCFHAIEKAKMFNFFNFNDFNVLEYDTYDKIQNGDMNWLVPRKFLAFIGPTECDFMNGHPPEFYIKYFLRNDIKTVIRLNNKVYDSTIFADAGIEHHELFFADGTTPPKHVLLRFLDICESSPAAIGVHCKAGLGRTGSLIGAYIIKHYKMSARESIAWMRICRPGSVIGQQQGWLEKVEGWLWRQGSQYRLQHFGDGDKIPYHRYGVYSKEWPIERRKLILQAQRCLENSDRSFLGLKINSPQRLSAPTTKTMTTLCNRSESEKRRAYIDKDYHKFAKLLLKTRNVPSNVNDESKYADQSVKMAEPVYFNMSNKLKELSNIENTDIKKAREKKELEKTQGDRLNDIKIRKQCSFETKTRSMSKQRPKKDGSHTMRERHSLRGDGLIYNKRNSSPIYYLTDMHENSERAKKRFESDHRRLVKNMLN